MKKTGMAKSDAKKLMGQMTAPGVAGFGNSGAAHLQSARSVGKADQIQARVQFRSHFGTARCA